MFKRKLREWFHAIVQKEVDRLIDHQRWSAANQIAQRNLMTTWKQSCDAGLVLPLSEVGFRVFSQFEEDGLLLYVFTLLGTENQIFVELGSSDGINSNCANLVINHGWRELFVDADSSSVDRGSQYYAGHPATWAYPPTFVQSLIGRDNVNEVLQDAGFVGEVDLLSIDIDGNDYWVWEAMTVLAPRVVIIETHTEFGMNSIVVPYDPDHVYPGRHPDYHGASVVAMEKLARQKGYRLVGAINYGFHTIYIRDGIGEDLFPAVPVESVLRHPRNQARFAQFEAIKDWDYITI